MSGGDIAVLITAITGGAAGLFAAIRSFSDTEIKGVSAVVSSYKSLVQDLQGEVGRLQKKVKDLEERVAELERELEYDTPS